MQGQAPGKRHQRRLADSARFLKSLIAQPRLTGAVAPSGRALARAMAAAAGPPPHGLIVELGPGTGPVTRSLIEAGVARERLVLIEYDPGFCQLLRQRFAPARIIEGDAYDLPRTLAHLAGEPIAAFVSSLPLLNQPPERREKLIGDAFALMGPSGSVRPVHLRSKVALSRGRFAPTATPPTARGRSCSICRRPGCGPTGSRPTQPRGAEIERHAAARKTDRRPRRARRRLGARPRRADRRERDIL